MTHRNIQQPHNTSARRTARSGVMAHARLFDPSLITVALSALVIVVVLLITASTGAG